MTGYISLSPAGKSLLMDISVCHCHPQDNTNNYVGLNDSVSLDWHWATEEHCQLCKAQNLYSEAAVLSLVK